MFLHRASHQLQAPARRPVPAYIETFSEAALETTMEAYPVLNKAKLKTELSLIYDNEEFKACSGAAI